MKLHYLILGLLPLAGCLGTAQEQLASQRPTTSAVRNNIAQAARTALKDPYSVRDAEISQIMGKGNNNYVCVQANTRNGFGGYTGRTGYTVFMNGERPVNVIVNNAWCSNPQIKYSRFHELEALKNL